MNLKMIALQISCFSSSIKFCLDPCPTDWWINWLYTTLAININQNDGITHISAFLKRSMMVSNRLYASPRSRDTSSCTETQHYPLWTISNEREIWKRFCADYLGISCEDEIHGKPITESIKRVWGHKCYHSDELWLILLISETRIQPLDSSISWAKRIWFMKDKIECSMKNNSFEERSFLNSYGTCGHP